MRETIKKCSGQIVGYLDHESNGDIIAKSYSGRILGKYERSSNTTKDYGGRILFYGNMSAALLVVNF